MLRSIIISLGLVLLATADQPRLAETAKSPISIVPFKDESSCGTCGRSYQACCFAFAAKGYPCQCHLQPGGNGTAGQNCGDCGTTYAACCVGYAAKGYPCGCDVDPSSN